MADDRQGCRLCKPGNGLQHHEEEFSDKQVESDYKYYDMDRTIEEAIELARRDT